MRIFVPAALISNTGSFMQGLGVPFTLFALTGSNTWVGAGVFANWAASLAVTPVAGQLADRMSRRLILLYSNCVQLVAALGLWLLAVAEALTPWRIIGLLAIAGLAAGFQYSASQALVPLLVEPAQRVQAVRINTVGFTAARATGPALAGLVLQTWGIKATFALNAASFMVVIIGLLLVRERAVASRGSAPWREQFADGFRYVMARPGLRRAMATIFVTALCGNGVVQLAAGIAAEIYGASRSGLGWMVAAGGVGSTLAAIALVFARHWPRARMAVFGMCIYALGVALVASTTVFAVGLVSFAVLGMGHVFAGTSVSTSLHAQVAEEYRGRVIAFYLMALLGGAPCGALLWGRLGDAIGLRAAFAIAFAALVVLIAVVVIRFGGLRTLDLDHDELAPAMMGQWTQSSTSAARPSSSPDRGATSARRSSSSSRRGARTSWSTRAAIARRPKK